MYSLNNLCLLSLSLTKKSHNICHLNVIHMHIIAICIDIYLYIYQLLGDAFYTLLA